MAPMIYRMTVILSTGEAFTFEAERKPRHWRSWIIQQLPYATAFLGATWKIEKVARSW